MEKSVGVRKAEIAIVHAWEACPSQSTTQVIQLKPKSSSHSNRSQTRRGSAAGRGLHAPETHRPVRVIRTRAGVDYVVEPVPVHRRTLHRVPPTRRRRRSHCRLRAGPKRTERIRLRWGALLLCRERSLVWPFALLTAFRPEVALHMGRSPK